MSDLPSNNPFWLAQRHGQDWRNEGVLTAIDWLVSLVPAAEWEPREAEVEARFQMAKVQWARGDRVALFDPGDTIAWYIHQARRYADPALRTDYFLPEGYRIVTLFQRLGELRDTLKTIDGGEARAARLMTQNISQPDDGIYELLVAGAYARRGWTKVAFVPEARGVSKTPDLLVERPRSRWAVECKRAGRSDYARDERAAGERMSERVHPLSRTAGRPLIVLVTFTTELHLLGESYLSSKVEQFLNSKDPHEWEDEHGEGVVFDVDWAPLHAVMTHDDIFFGSSRMVELLLGRYEPVMDFSMAGDWTPARDRPLHAHWVDHVSLVVWGIRSLESARRKATHFRGLVARASEQLPGDRPGVIHVGYESVGGNTVDGRRHFLNMLEMRTFDPGATRLRTVYGNYFTNELVTARNESAAVSETLATYRVGTGRLMNPLPAHLLLSDENGTPGAHF